MDFVVEQSAELQEAVIDLKAGTHVTLDDALSAGRLQVYCKGSALGHVPTDQEQQLKGSACTCTVRSIRKQDGKITQILVRAVLSTSVPVTLPDHPAADSTQLPELEDMTQLPQHKLELLASDESLRSILKDERLQEEIRAIDAADDREKALQHHFQNPDFKLFADKVLGVVAAS